MLAALVASVQLNAVTFDTNDPLSEGSRALTVKLYRTTCYAEQQEKRDVGVLPKDAQLQLLEIEQKMDGIRSEISGLPQEIKTASFWGQTLNASDFLGKSYTDEKRQEDLAKAQKLSGQFTAGLSALDSLEGKVRFIKATAPTVLPELGGMDARNLRGAKETLRGLVNSFGKLSKEDAVTSFLSAVKLGFDEEMIDGLLKKYGQQAAADFEKYYTDPCKK